MKSLLKLIFIIVAFVIINSSCGKKEEFIHKTESNTISTDNSSITDFKIEFIELGSVNCTPCKKMQPIMKSIENKYRGLVKVTFYDVWKDNAPAKRYGIRVIPSQIFLDANGKELMRHEGFFPEEEIDKFLQSQQISIPQ